MTLTVGHCVDHPQLLPSNFHPGITEALSILKLWRHGEKQERMIDIVFWSLTFISDCYVHVKTACKVMFYACELGMRLSFKELLEAMKV